MALLGINYKPTKEKKRIFDRNDMLEYFRPTIEQFDVTPQPSVMHTTQDSLMEAHNQSFAEPQKYDSMYMPSAPSIPE